MCTVSCPHEEKFCIFRVARASQEGAGNVIITPLPLPKKKKPTTTTTKQHIKPKNKTKQQQPSGWVHGHTGPAYWKVLSLFLLLYLRQINMKG